MCSGSNLGEVMSGNSAKIPAKLVLSSETELGEVEGFDEIT